MAKKKFYTTKVESMSQTAKPVVYQQYANLLSSSS